MVMGETSCWRSGECRRGWASRPGSRRAGAAASGPGEPTAGAGAVAVGSGLLIEAGPSAALCSGCCCDFIACSFLFSLGSLLLLYAADFFTASQDILARSTQTRTVPGKDPDYACPHGRGTLPRIRDQSRRPL